MSENKLKKKATSWLGLQTWEEWFAVRVGAAGFLCGSPPCPVLAGACCFGVMHEGGQGRGSPQPCTCCRECVLGKNA